MSSRKLDRNLILSLEDELEDDSLVTQSLISTQSLPIFKKKGLKGKKLNHRKVTLDFDESDEEAEKVSFLTIKRPKFKSPHSFIVKRQAFKSTVDDKPITKIDDDDVKYTQTYLEKLKNQQEEQNEYMMEIDDDPLIVETTPTKTLREFRKDTPIDNDNDEQNIIPANEYGSDDNDNDFATTTANNFPADDDLIPNNDDAFIDDGPLNLTNLKKNQSFDIDEDLYDMELPMGDEDLEVELGISKPTVIEPANLTEHLEILKQSIRNLRSDKNETEAQCNKIEDQLNAVTKTKEQLLIELNL